MAAQVASMSITGEQSPIKIKEMKIGGGSGNVSSKKHHFSPKVTLES